MPLKTGYPDKPASKNKRKKKKMNKRKTPKNNVAFRPAEKDEEVSLTADESVEDFVGHLTHSLYESLGDIRGVDVGVEEVYTDSVVLKTSLVKERDADTSDLEEVTVADDTVEAPTEDQRKGLPDTAFAAVFIDGEGRTRKILPHHINTVESASDHESVDTPRLKNALARFNQLKGVPREVQSLALSHINSHAKALKVGSASELIYYNTLTLEDEVYHLIPYTRDENGDFTFEDAILVEKEVSYIEIQDGEAAPEKVSEAVILEEGTVPQNKEEYVESFLIETVLTEDCKAKAPNGEPFLAILEGRGAVAGVVNKNFRLYTPQGMRENVNRLSARIAAAFENGESENNFDIIAGEADHPGAFEGARLQATCTQLIEATFDGTDVRVKFGLMDTTSGQNMLKLKKFGMPLGVSTRAFGAFEKKTMDEDNPFFEKNKDFDGEDYAEIGDFSLEAFDLVAHPSAQVFIGEQAEDTKQEMLETYNKVFKAPESKENKITSPITEVINPQETTQMDKAALKEQLKDLTVEDLKELCPDLCESMETVAVETAAKETPEVVEQAPDTELADAFREAKAELTATKEIVERLVSEKENAERQTSLVVAIDEAVKGVSYGDACKSFLNEMLIENPKATAEDVPGLVAKYVENILPKFPAKAKEEDLDESKKSSSKSDSEVLRKYSDVGITGPIS